MATINDATHDSPSYQNPTVQLRVEPGQDGTRISQGIAPQQDSSSKTSSTLTPSLADDADLIEDDWVDIVRKIIEDNRSDPYSLSQAMTALRADYMKKRYNKDIKTPD